MGKKTLYHPVSVTVIRGALEFCGVVPGRLIQMSSDFNTGSALYTLEILAIPVVWERLTAAELSAHLNGCFASDVEVRSLRMYHSTSTGQHKITITLFVKASGPFEENVFEDLDSSDVFDRPQEGPVLE